MKSHAENDGDELRHALLPSSARRLVEPAYGRKNDQQSESVSSSGAGPLFARGPLIAAATTRAASTRRPTAMARLVYCSCISFIFYITYGMLRPACLPAHTRASPGQDSSDGPRGSGVFELTAWKQPREARYGAKVVHRRSRVLHLDGPASGDVRGGRPGRIGCRRDRSCHRPLARLRFRRDGYG